MAHHSQDCAPALSNRADSPAPDTDVAGTRSWAEALALYTQRRVVAMAFLGFSAGLPFLLVFSTLTAWLTEYGVSRTTIGFFAWVGTTYSVKVFWAPVVDRVGLPGLTRLLGQRRSWMLLAQCGIAAGLAGMALVGPGELAVVAALAVLVAFSSSTQDIAIDAWRIEAAQDRDQGAMAASYIFGYRVALLVAGAGALFLADTLGWVMSYLVMAALVGIGMVTVLLVREPEGSRASPDSVTDLVDGAASRGGRAARWFADAVVAPFVDFFRRNGTFALVVLLFVAVFRLSDITMGVMANPFYLDLGYTKSEIAAIAKVFGFGMTIAGSALAGVLVVRYGLLRPLLGGAVAVATTNLLFAGLAVHGQPDTVGLAVVISADNLSGGFATTTFVAYLSSLTNRAYTATQYALFSSLMTLPGKFVSGFAGVVVDAAGYALFFCTAAGLGVPAILLVLVLLRHARAAAAPTAEVSRGSS